MNSQIIGRHLGQLSDPARLCALTKSGRQQLAYEKYVRKCSYTRDRQRSKMKMPRMAMPASAPSENKVSADLVDAPSPQSVTTGDSQTEQ